MAFNAQSTAKVISERQKKNKKNKNKKKNKKKPILRRRTRRSPMKAEIIIYNTRK